MIKLDAIVYVAGPYSSPDAWARELNIRAAETVSLDLALEGFSPLCPHTIARYWFGAITEPRAIEIGLRLLEASEAVVLVDGWERSSGTLGEIRRAHEYAIPIFGSVQTLAWARDGCVADVLVAGGVRRSSVEGLGWQGYVRAR